MTKREKIIQAIKDGKIIDRKSLEFFLLFDEINQVKLGNDLEKKIDKLLGQIQLIRGEDGNPGKDGYTPTDKDLLKLIKPLIPYVKDGKDGKTPTNDELLSLIRPLIASIRVPTAQEVANLIPVPEAPQIEEIIPQLPKLGEEIRDSLELLTGEERLDKSAIRGLDELIDKKVKFIGGGSTARNFYQLLDTGSYAGQGGKVVKVKSDESGLEYGVATDTDEKVKYDVNDPTAGYIADKFVAGTDITLSEGTGADENKLKISYSGTPMVYPGSGIAVSTGSAWGTSITGLSSQFVKADGSLDSSTYLTAETDPLSLHLAAPNQTVTQTPTFDAGILLTEQADPSTPDSTHGILYTSDTNGKTNLNYLTNDGLKMRIGRDLISTVRNTSGSTIAVGKVVYQTGSTGTAPNVALAKADSENTLPAIGITMESISNNGYGRIQRFGRTEFSLDTNAYTEGDRLWVSATTAGEFTNVKPTHPNHPQPIGQVVVKGSGNGSIFTSFTSWYNEDFDGTVNNTFTFGATTATSQILAKTATAQRTATFPDKSGTVAFTSDLGDYAKLDGTNQPFTGNINVSKTSPAYYLTNGADDAELKKVTLGRELTLKNDVGTPAGNPYAVSTTAGNYPNQQYVTMSNSVNVTTTGTISLWFKRTGTGQAIFHSAGTGTKYIRATYTGSTLTATFYDGTSKTISHSLADSLWHNLTVTFNTGSTGAKMYLDGASVGTPLGPWTFTKSDTTVFWIGSYNIYGGSGENWTGVFDEAGVWSRELTAGEVSDIYNSGNGLYLDTANNFPSSGTPISTNLLVIHHMNEGTGNTVNDSSGNGYNGTKTANASWVTGEKAIAPTSSQQSTVISSKDGTLAGEKGIHTFGDTSGRTVLDGLTTRFNVGGSEKGQLSTTMAWTVPNTIAGSSDVIQLKGISNATQTTKPFSWYQSDGTTLVHAFDNSGNVTLKAGADIRPTSNSTTAINIAQADGTDFVTFDTTNKQVGIGTTPSNPLHINYDGVDNNVLYINASSSSLNLATAFLVRLPATGAQKGFGIFKGSDALAFAQFENNIGGTNKPGFAFGPGTSARDTNIYRDGADILKTDDSFAVGGNVILNAGQDIRPSSNSTNAINIAQADGTDFVTFDTTNKHVKIPVDSSKLYFGAGDDASINFTGTSFDIRSDVVTATDKLNLRGGTNGTGFLIGANEEMTLTADLLTFSDSTNIAFNTTTGTKIGTATSQKLGFWNATPIVQPTTSVGAATLVGGGGTTITDTDTFDGYTLKQIVKALRNIGLLQ
jgi:hypothetical protein